MKKLRLKRIIALILVSIIFMFILKYFFDNYDISLLYNTVTNDIKQSVPVIIGFSEELSPTLEFCGHIKKPTKIAINNNNWQEVLYQTVYLYSAYYDNRFKLNGNSYHYVRVISVIRGNQNTALKCYLWTSDSSQQPLIVNAVKNEIWIEFWSKSVSSDNLYKAYLLSCAVPKPNQNKVHAVSIVSDRCEKPLTYIVIKKADSNADTKEFAVCVKGLDFREDISMRLIEWIELQIILGTDLISFYVYSVHPNTRKVLSYYERVGKANVYELSLPGTQPNIAHIRSQYLSDNIWQKRRIELIPYNDCLYRHLYTHRFIVLLDIDEAIVPVMHTNWKEMFDYILSYNAKAFQQYSSFSAQNVYFFGSFMDKINPKILDTIPSHMKMMRHIYRSANFSKPGYAAKSFVLTNATLSVFNHYALFPLYNNLSRYSVISRSVAHLHHYRDVCPNTMIVECNENFLKFWKKDTLIWKFKKNLTEKVNRVRKINDLEIYS